MNTGITFPRKKAAVHEADRVPRSRTVELHLHCHLCFHSVMLDLLSSGKTLPFFTLMIYSVVLHLVQTYRLQHSAFGDGNCRVS
jgi:hypothetical protein